MENVEAVARGVASVAAAFEFFDCPQGNGETLVEARIVDEGWTAVHPTRHGAALAAFDAAWEEGREPRSVASGLERLVDGEWLTVPPDGDPWHARRSWIGDALKRKALSDQAQDFAERHGMPLLSPTMPTPRTPGDIAEKLMLGPWPPRRHGKTAAMRKHAAEWEAKGGEVAWIDPEPSPQVRRLRELTNEAARNLMAGFGASSPDVDAETVRLWCEEMNADLVARPGYFAIDFPRGSWGLRVDEVMAVDGRWYHHPDPLGWFERNLPPQMPTHVADAMVREARRVLGGGA